MAAMAGRRRAAVRKVPLFQLPSFFCLAPSERGKNSYQLPTAARVRSTRSVRGMLRVISDCRGFARMAATIRLSDAAARRSSGVNEFLPTVAAASASALLVGWRMLHVQEVRRPQ